jgi:hypothetical protein
MMIKGVDLTAAQREMVLATFPHRNTTKQGSLLGTKKSYARAVHSCL